MARDDGRERVRELRDRLGLEVRVFGDLAVPPKGPTAVPTRDPGRRPREGSRTLVQTGGISIGFPRGHGHPLGSALSKEGPDVVSKDSADDEQHAPGSSDESDGKAATKGRGVVPRRVGPEAEGGDSHDDEDARHENGEAEAVVATPAGKDGLI